ncbi:unnamed protein product, partial [Ixodes persulcatus]
MNGDGTAMEDYRGSMHATWNPPVVIKQEPDFDLYPDTAQQQRQPHHAVGSHYLMGMSPENGAHYGMGSNPLSQLEEEAGEASPPGPKKRGRKKKSKADDPDIPSLGLEPGAPVPVIRKRGRPRKYPIAQGLEYVDTPEGRRVLKQEKLTDTFKQRKKIDRFEGMPEEEVAKRTLPDHLVPNLDIVI